MPVYELDPYQRLLALKIATADNQRPIFQPSSITNNQFSQALQAGLNQPYDAQLYAVQQGVMPPSETTNRDVLMRLLDLSPGFGDAIAIDEGINELKQGNNGMAALNFASAVPAIGDAAKLLGAGGVGLAGLLAQMGRQAGKAPVTPFSRQAGVIGYHGSPHKFDAFDIKHLGSGEGAQAYGHGLYFAENPEVAKTYASVGETIGGSTTEARLAKRLDTAQNAGKYTEASVIEDLLVNRSPAMARARFTVENGYSPEFVNEANKIINELSPKFKDPALYKVDIPDEYANNFLDWDKPLSEQPESVRKAIAPMVEKMKKMSPEYTPDNITGAGLYQIMRDYRGGSDVASSMFNEAGIKGIRYLDQGSREAGKGTSNFVVFDDKIIKILERK